MRSQICLAGAGWFPVLVLLVAALILLPVVLWVFHVAVALLWLTTKVCLGLLAFLFVLYCLKVMMSKLKS